MKTYIKYQAELQLAEGPDDPLLAHRLERKMGFSYRQAISELIYALTVCRVDISIAVITLSQYASRPSQIHYEAVKQVFCI